MKFIDKCRKLTKKGINKKFEDYYLQACGCIKYEAQKGKYDTYYYCDDRMKHDIYKYIKQKLEKEGFKIEFDSGLNTTRLFISWEE